MNITTGWFASAALALAASAPFLAAQTDNRVTPNPKVAIAWDRFYDYGQVVELLRRLEAAHPGWLKIVSIGKSVEGRDLWLAVVSDPAGPPDTAKPAMYIDANVHGNEIQGTEVCLYTLWYLLENRDRRPKIQDLLRRVAFYVLPMVNPDGRQWWFDGPNNSSSSRSGKAPVDDDRDGLADEDGPDDLDGDGSITQMRKKVAHGGTHIIDPDDPRLLKRVEDGKEGTHILFWAEGIDNDGDGEINEDPPGGYDMNRNWPADWQPNWLQHGAGDHPLSWPETRGIADFLLAHPNVAALQSYHNSGGMILRGPGAKETGEYPGQDVHVYDEIGHAGETILPHYRYIVLWKDLYTVHGGFVTWAFEGLGIFAFTNELWSSEQYGGRGTDADDGRRQRLEWDDRLEFGGQFKNWTPFVHPQYGEVEIGGFIKSSSRVPPTFMLEELCHRNMAFTLFHADAMPGIRIEDPEIEDLQGGLWRVRAEVRNDRLIPTIAALAQQRGIGLPDFFEIDVPGAKVVAGGVLNGPPLREEVRSQEHRPQRMVIDSGVPSHGRVRVEWIVASAERPAVKLTYRSQKGGTVSR